MSAVNIVGNYHIEGKRKGQILHYECSHYQSLSLKKWLREFGNYKELKK